MMETSTAGKNVRSPYSFICQKLTCLFNGEDDNSENCKSFKLSDTSVLLIVLLTFRINHGSICTASYAII